MNKPLILAMDKHAARLAFPCGAHGCSEDDCVHVVLSLEPGINWLDMPPFWRACVILGPHGNDLREHDAAALLRRAEEEMDSRGAPLRFNINEIG